MSDLEEFKVFHPTTGEVLLAVMASVRAARSSIHKAWMATYRLKKGGWKKTHTVPLHKCRITRTSTGETIMAHQEFSWEVSA